MVATLCDVKHWYILGGMLQTERETGASAFACMHRMYVAETLNKVVHIMQIFVHFYLVAEKVFKSSACNVTLKFQLILSLVCDAEVIQTS